MLDKVNRYIDYRRSLGFNMRTQRDYLRSFAQYAEQCAFGKPLTVELVLRWAAEPKKVQRRYYANRLSAIRSFARYLAIFEPQTQIPPTGVFGPIFSRTTPHIYTKQEILALINAVRIFKSRTIAKKHNSLRNVTILGLLACTGMRTGEVLALNNEDVDLGHAILTVRNSKNLPMRLIPVKKCTVRHLCKYQEARNRCFGPSKPSDPFIRSSFGVRLRYCSLRSVFKKIRKRAGLTGRSATGREVRLRDFRHTFACNHLLRAYREKRNIDNAVHDLSVYLGHATVHCTYWYLSGVPKLFSEYTRLFELEARRLHKGGVR
jgi:integrase